MPAKRVLFFKAPFTRSVIFCIVFFCFAFSATAVFIGRFFTDLRTYFSGLIRVIYLIFIGSLVCCMLQGRV